MRSNMLLPLLARCLETIDGFQRQQPTSGGAVRSFRPVNCCHKHIPPNHVLDGFPYPSQFAAAKLTHYSSQPQQPLDSL